MSDNRPKKRNNKLQSLDKVDIPEVNYDIVDYDAPELSEEALRKRALNRKDEDARRALSTTGPIVIGKKGDIAQSVPVGSAEASLRNPNINYDPNARQVAGMQKLGRMAPQQASVGSQPVSPDVAEFARGKQGYEAPVEMNLNPVGGVQMQSAGASPNIAQPGISSDPTQQQIVGAQRMSRMTQQQVQGEQAASPDVANFANGKQNYEYQEQMNMKPVNGVQMQTPNVTPNLGQPNLSENYSPTSEQLIGAQRMSRMTQHDNQPESSTSPDVEAFAQGKQNYHPQVEQPMQSNVTTEGMQPVGADHYAGVYAGQQSVPQGAVASQPQQPANMFAKTPSTFGTQPLSKPVSVFDTSKSVEENMAGNGNPSVSDIASAYRSQDTNSTPPEQTSKPVPTVNPDDSRSGMDVLSSLYTSPEDELKERRASRTRQRIMALGDALRHIGNIYNTVNYAPSQQFNDPVGEERKRYQEERALRDANNYKYMTYQQAKAAQDAKMKQLEAQTKYQNEALKIRQAEHDRLVGAQKLAERKQQAYEDIKKEEMELKKKLAENNISNAESRRLQAQAAWLRAEKYVPGGAGGGVNGYTVTEETTVHRDADGKETGRTKTKTRKGSGSSNNLNLTGAKDGKSNDPKNLGLKK